MRGSIAGLLLLTVAAPLAAQDAPTLLSDEDAAKFAMAGLDKYAAKSAEVRDWEPAKIEAALKADLSDRTKLIFQHGHGVYIEYTAPDGQLRMWYPGNTKVVVGRWGVRASDGKVQACFKYLASVDRTTGRFEPQDCIHPGQTLSGANVLKAWSGDVFKLMSGSIPYRKSTMSMPEPQ